MIDVFVRFASILSGPAAVTVGLLLLAAVILFDLYKRRRLLDSSSEISRLHRMLFSRALVAAGQIAIAAIGVTSLLTGILVEKQTANPPVDSMPEFWSVNDNLKFSRIDFILTIWPGECVLMNSAVKNYAVLCSLYISSSQDGYRLNIKGQTSIHVADNVEHRISKVDIDGSPYEFTQEQTVATHLLKEGVRIEVRLVFSGIVEHPPYLQKLNLFFHMGDLADSEGAKQFTLVNDTSPAASPGNI